MHILLPRTNNTQKKTNDVLLYILSWHSAMSYDVQCLMLDLLISRYFVFMIIIMNEEYFKGATLLSVFATFPFDYDYSMCISVNSVQIYGCVNYNSVLLKTSR